MAASTVAITAGGTSSAAPQELQMPAVGTGKTFADLVDQAMRSRAAEPGPSPHQAQKNDGQATSRISRHTAPGSVTAPEPRPWTTVTAPVSSQLSGDNLSPTSKVVAADPVYGDNSLIRVQLLAQVISDASPSTKVQYLEPQSSLSSPNANKDQPVSSEKSSKGQASSGPKSDEEVPAKRFAVQSEEATLALASNVGSLQPDQAPELPRSLQATEASFAVTSADGLSAVPGQAPIQAQREVVSLEKANVVSFAESTLAREDALPTSLMGTAVLATRGTAAPRNTNEVAAPSVRLIGATGSSGNKGMPDAHSSDGGSGTGQPSSQSKTSAPPPSDSRRNGPLSQQTGKSTASSQADAGVNPGANSAAKSASVGAQVAATNVPAASNQPSSAASQASHQAGATSDIAPQTTGDKIAVAIDRPIDMRATPVNAATMLQNQSQAEMRVAVQTDTMGAVQLHAVLAGDRLGASIAVLNHEAHTILSNELPALQQVLADKNLAVDRLAVVHSSPSNSGFGGGDGHNPQPRDSHQTMSQSMQPSKAFMGLTIVNSSEKTVQEEILGRLSVRA